MRRAVQDMPEKWNHIHGSITVDLGLSHPASLHVSRVTGSLEVKSQALWRKPGLSQPL
jgi:hypothetical protein